MTTMATRAESIQAMQPLFQAVEGGSIPTSALQLRIEEIGFTLARSLNEKWHSRLPRIGDPPGTTNAMECFAATFEHRVFAVAIWSHPVSRALPQDTHLELRRMAICDDRPKNTASRMLAIMVRLLRKKRPELTTLLSYQDLGVHSGTIYTASGWQRAAIKKYSSWNNSTRNRPECQAKADKQRWELNIKPE